MSDDEIHIEHDRIEEELQAIDLAFWNPDFAPLPLVVEIISNELEDKPGAKKLKDIISYQQKIVNMAVEMLIADHYEPFNASVESFSKIFDAYANAQSQVRDLRSQIQHCRELIHERKGGLREALLDKLKTESMLVLLKKVAVLNDSQKQYEHLLRHNKYEELVKFVIETQDALFSPDLNNIGALNDLQRTWPNKRIDLGTILLAELSDIIYQKGKYVGIEASQLDIVNTEEGEPFINQSSINRTNLGTIVRSFLALDQLKWAMQEIYSHLRVELNKVVEYHINECKKNAGDKENDGGKQPLQPILTSEESSKGDSALINNSLSGELGNSASLIRLLNNILASFKSILCNHVIFFRCINAAVRAVKDVPKVYSVDDVWVSVQMEVTTLLAAQLQANVPGSVTNMAVHEEKGDKDKGDKVQGGRVKAKNVECSFHFSDSAAWTVPVDSKTINSKGKTWTPCPPSPYQIIIVYQPCWNFYREGKKILEESQINSRDSTNANKNKNTRILTFFFFSFIQNTLVPRLTQDVHERTSDILCGADAFISTSKIVPVQNSVIPRNVVMVNSTIEIFGIVNEMMNNIIALPTYVVDFIPVLETQLERNIMATVEQLKQAINGSHTAARLEKNSAKITNLLATSPSFVELVTNELHVSTTTIVNDSTITMEQFELDLINGYPDPPFDNELSTLISPFTLGLICHMFESLRFLSHIIRNLSVGVIDTYLTDNTSEDNEQDKININNEIGIRKTQNNNNNKARENNKSAITVRRLSLRSRLLPTLSMMRLEGAGNTSRPTSPINSPKANKATETKTIHQPNAYSEILEIAKPHLLKLGRVADRYDNVSYRMLFTLKVELRVVCYAHISGILKSSYCFDVEPDQVIEADGFLHELHSNLLAIDGVFSTSLTNAVRLYIYDGLQDLLPTILVKGLRHLFYRKVTAPGVERLCKNISAIQQTLTSIGMKDKISQSKCDKAINYFRLLLKTEAELVTFIVENPKAYDLDQLKVIWNLEGPYRKATVEANKNFEKVALANFVS